jgi:hypothetical protein
MVVAQGDLGTQQPLHRLTCVKRSAIYLTQETWAEIEEALGQFEHNGEFEGPREMWSRRVK